MGRGRKTDRQTDRGTDSGMDTWMEHGASLSHQESTFPSVHADDQAGSVCLTVYQRWDPASHSVAFGSTTGLSTSSLGFVIAPQWETLAAATRCGGIPVGNHFLLIRHRGAHIWPRRLSLNSPAGCSARRRIVPPVGRRSSLHSVGGRRSLGLSEFANELGKGRLTPASLCVLL